MKYRYFIELAYKGTHYHGWQVQPNAVSVQEKLNAALAILFRQEIETLGAGRTDTGVHARQLYAHFDLDAILSPDELLKRAHQLNSMLPGDISIQRIIPVSPEAHARFDAVSRTYEYWIYQQKDPFLAGFASYLHAKPDLAEMNRVARLLLRYEDFSCFSKSNTQVFTNNCRITHAEWVEQEGKIVFTIRANRFLRNMVRAIVGTLLEVGLGKLDEAGFVNILESKNRSDAGTSVPACGLYLTKVIYPYIEEK